MIAELPTLTIKNVEPWEVDALHHDVPFPDYLKWPVMSQSTLKEGRKSMAHLRAALDGERVKVPTDDMILGSALHTAFLEPAEVQERVVVWDGAARRGKEWEAFKSEHSQKIILTQSQSAQLNGMVESLRAHPEVRKWTDKIEAVEVSAVGLIHDLRMKGRCDALTGDPLIDLKKVSDGDPRKVVNAAIQFGYDLQAWVYCQLFGRDRFMLITVEDEAPYDVCPYELSPAMLRRGQREASLLIEQVLECKETGYWPGRSTIPVQLELPEWAASESAISY